MRVLLALPLIVSLAAGCTSRRCDDTYPPVPARLEAAHANAEDLGALDVHKFSSGGIPVTAVVFVACSSDHRVVFYRSDNGNRIGPEFNLLNSARPQLVGSPAVLSTANLEPLLRMHFIVTETDVDLVPDDGPWVTIKPGVSPPSRGESAPN